MVVEKYKYKLNYLDFIKMMISSNLYELQKYLYLQKEPLEIEVYFEEVLLSTNHSQFNIGPHISRFAPRYYSKIETIVENILQSGARENFKIQSLNKEFVEGMILSYFDLLDKVREVQWKLLERMRSDYIPITITANSYILNRLVTSYKDYTTQEIIPLSEFKGNSDITEAQYKNLHITMNCLTLETIDVNAIYSTIRNSRVKKKFESLLEYKDKESLISTYTAEVLKATDMIENICMQRVITQLDEWKRGNIAQINLPCYTHPSRKLLTDWSYTKCKMEKSILID